MSEFKIRDCSTYDTMYLVKAAWKELRRRYPTIACETKDDASTYDDPPDGNVDSWVDGTFTALYGITASELLSELEPATVAKCYYLHQQSEVLFHYPYAMMDGAGATLFMKAFFKILESPSESLQHGATRMRLSPSLVEAAGLPRKHTPLTQACSVVLLHMLVAHQTVPASEPPESPWMLGRPRRYSINLGSALAIALDDACTKGTATMIAATHAALSQALKSGLNVPGSEPRPFVTAVSVDLRRLCGAQAGPKAWYDYDKNPVTFFAPKLYISLWPTDFDSDLAYIMYWYRRRTSGPVPQMVSYLCAYWYTALQNQTLTTLRKRALPVATNPDLACLDDVSDVISDTYGNGRIQVLDFWEACEVRVPRLLIHVWSFKGELRLQASYNDGCYDEESVKAFLGKVERKLAVGLKVAVAASDDSGQGVTRGNNGSTSDPMSGAYSPPAGNARDEWAFLASKDVKAMAKTSFIVPTDEVSSPSRQNQGVTPPRGSDVAWSAARDSKDGNEQGGGDIIASIQGDGVSKASTAEGAIPALTPGASAESNVSSEDDASESKQVADASARRTSR